MVENLDFMPHKMADAEPAESAVCQSELYVWNKRNGLCIYVQKNETAQLTLSPRGPTLDARFWLYRHHILTSKVEPRTEILVVRYF